MRDSSMDKQEEDYFSEVDEEPAPAPPIPKDMPKPLAVRFLRHRIASVGRRPLPLILTTTCHTPSPHASSQNSGPPPPIRPLVPYDDDEDDDSVFQPKAKRNKVQIKLSTKP